ncbi:hypothetical protein FVW20_04285 [Desulfovibrio oxamicus]|uniref:Uncharacterized protein n=1 Tax=Nitratidesulfovibrio oxamicus TaxID=32016 RepID=A0ABS0J283_9BACT|nr:hypothetical protein [Nitratidesulfovibrio oxamicus]MBG3876267.1 hypothetical protein [Nitratidesulfovibrio oxamicus]
MNTHCTNHRPTELHAPHETPGHGRGIPGSGLLTALFRHWQTGGNRPGRQQAAPALPDAHAATAQQQHRTDEAPVREDPDCHRIWWGGP